MYSMVHSKVDFYFGTTCSRDVSRVIPDVSHAELYSARYAHFFALFGVQEGLLVNLEVNFCNTL